MDCVRSLLIPLAECYLLLPNTAVIEILEYIEPDISAISLHMPHHPQGILGEMNWNGEAIDMFSWELYTGKRLPPPTITQCFVVIRLPQPNTKPATVALLSQRIPHLLTVKPDMLQSVPADDAGVFKGGIPVRVNGEAAWIPDLTQLQQQLGAPSLEGG